MEQIVLDQETQVCQQCGKTFMGRAGQKFCSAIHKSRFHNRQRQILTEGTQGITATILRNRSILKSLFALNGEKPIATSELLASGFQPRYITSVEGKFPMIFEFILKNEGANVRIVKHKNLDYGKL